MLRPLATPASTSVSTASCIWGTLPGTTSLHLVLHISCTCSFLLHKTLSRYRAHNDQAETFYRHAISLAPSSGQPYNQVQFSWGDTDLHGFPKIAILEASRQNKLATVYFYVRAVSLK